jgi:diacylglycerol kinase (ATP)
MEKSSSRICFLVNPSAGKRYSENFIAKLKREASRRWHDFEIVIASPDDSFSDLATDYSEDYDVIVACGGDGTVNRVVNGLAETDCTLGVLAIGTGNDFAKAIRSKHSFTRNLDLLQQENVSVVDLIHYSGDAEGWCANTLGLGLDGLANYYTKSFKTLSGPLVYVIGAIKAAWNFKGAGIEMTIDHKEHKENFLMMTACNGNWEGGKFYLAPDAELTDGSIHFVTIRKIPFLKIMAYLPRFRWGPAKWMGALETIECRQIMISSDRPLALHADGEHIGLGIQKLNIQLKAGQLKVITGY